RWSMGLLICLSGAPWTGVEIDKVNRVGRALEGHVGDDQVWFEEWTRMGAKVEAWGLGTGKGPPAHGCRLLHAREPLLPDRRAVHPSALPAEPGCLRHVSEALPRGGCHHPPPAHRAGRGAL